MIDGPFERFHASGSCFQRGQFEMGKRVGAFEAFYRDGTPWFRFHFVDDKPSGVWEIFHPGRVLSRRIDWSRTLDPDADADAMFGPDPRVQRLSYDGTEGNVVATFSVDAPDGTLLIRPVGDRLVSILMSGQSVDVGQNTLPAFRPEALLHYTSTEVYDVCQRSPEHFDAVHAAGFLLRPPSVVDDGWLLHCNLHAGGLESIGQVTSDDVAIPPAIALASRLHMLNARWADDDEDARHAFDPDAMSRIVPGLRAFGAEARARYLESLLTGKDPRSFRERLLRRSLHSCFEALPAPRWPAPAAFINDDWLAC